MILKLPMTRFVAQVSNGCSRSKYAYLAMQQELEEALKTCSWHEASTPMSSVTLTVNQLTRTDANKDDKGNWLNHSSYTAYLDDRYDAYKQAGDAVAADATMCGYAGMVAYRLKLPSTFVNNSSARIEKINLTVARDRYCRSGLRVACYVNDSETPYVNWATIRGESTTTASNFCVVQKSVLAQTEAAYLLAGRADETTLEFARGSVESDIFHTHDKYLWIYLTLEDYCDYWEDYSPKEKRQYYIEGSGMIVSARTTIEFNSYVTPDVDAGLEVPVYVPGLTPLPMKTDDAIHVAKDAADQFAPLTSYTNLFVINLPNRGFYGAKSTTKDRILYYREMASKFLGIVRHGNYKGLYRSSVLGGSVIDPSNYGNSLLPSEFGHVYGVPASNYDGDYDTITADKEAHESFSGRYPGYYPLGVWLNFAPVAKRAAIDESGYIPGVVDTFCVNKHMLAMSYQAYIIPPNTDVSSKTAFEVCYGTVNDIGLDVSILCWRTRSPDVYGIFGRAALSGLAEQSAFWTGSQRKISGSPQSINEDFEIPFASAELVCEVKPVWSALKEKWLLKINLPAGAFEPGDVMILAPKINGIRGDWEQALIDYFASTDGAWWTSMLTSGYLIPYGSCQSQSDVWLDSWGFGTMFGQMVEPELITGQLL